MVNSFKKEQCNAHCQMYIVFFLMRIDFMQIQISISLGTGAHLSCVLAHTHRVTLFLCHKISLICGCHYHCSIHAFECKY